MWLLPALLLLTAIVLSIPLSAYFAWLMDGKYRAPRVLKWFEDLIDTGPQDWKQYVLAMMAFSFALFVFGFVVLSLQPIAPLNPRGLGILAPSTIFNTVISFMTNTNLQHYSGDQHLSNFSQIFFILPNMFLSASVGFCALAAIIRAFRGEATVGNFFVDMWRVAIYIYLPVSLIFGVIFVQQGMPMTYASTEMATTLEPGSMGLDDKGQAKQQTIVVGPVAAVIPIKMLGTNGGGFYGMNSAHPLENPTATSNFFTTLAMMIFPFSLVLMYGRMLGRIRHSVVIYSVMLAMMAGLIAWVIVTDTMRPNPGLTAHAGATYQVANPSAPNGKIDVVSPAVVALPVDQHLGNLEGKELRFGTSAGAAFAAITTDVTCGAINAEMDSLNPLSGLSPMIGMWLNCVFGGKGVGMINLLLVPHRRRVPRRADGRPHARISGPEGRRAGDEARDDRAARAPHPHPGAERSVRRHGLGHDRGVQSGRARLQSNRLPVFVGIGEQRLGHGWPWRDLRPEQQHQSVAGSGSVGHRHGPGDAVQPLSADHRADRHGLLAGTQKGRPGHSRHNERRHRDFRLPVARNDRGRRRALVPSRRRARAYSRALGTDSLRRLIPIS